MTEQFNNFLDSIAVQHIGNKIDAVINGYTLAYLEKRGLTQDYLETLTKESENLYDVDRLTSLYLTMGQETLVRRLEEKDEQQEQTESAS